jgi:hypothetical protein
MPRQVLQIQNGETYMVNGQDLTGPAEVWKKSEIFETSFVPLGADGNTSVAVFSRFEEAAQPETPDNRQESADAHRPHSYRATERPAVGA